MNKETEVNYMQTNGNMHCFTCHKFHATDKDCPGEPSACTPDCGDWYNPFKSLGVPSESDPDVTKIKHLLKVGESEGWDYFFGRRDACCPGDDYAAVYNLALDDYERAVLDPDWVESMEAMRFKEENELDQSIEDIILEKND